MKTSASVILVSTMLLLWSTAMADVQKMSGKNSGRSHEFTVAGPWTMDWTARSEFPLLASIEVRLYEKPSGDFVGMVAEIKGTGSGLKVFDDVGTFQVVVVGNFVEWDIEIQEIGEEEAAKLKRSAEGRPSIADAAGRASRLVPEGSFESWRPQSNEVLLLFNEDGMGWSASFSPACPGLDDATAISFVMVADDGSVGQYDSILLEDGQRCYFDTVIPKLLQ